MAIWAAAISGAASLAGGAMSANSAKKAAAASGAANADLSYQQNIFNANEARIARDWEMGEARSQMQFQENANAYLLYTSQEIRESASRVGLNTALEDKSVQEVNRIYSEIAKMAVDMDLVRAQTSESYSRIPSNKALAGKYSAEAAVSTETERSLVTDRYLRKKVGDIEKTDLPKPLAEIPLDLIKGLLFRFIK